MKNDLINSPDHYNIGIETYEYIKSWDMDYAQGNVIKYVSRFKYKKTAKQDLLKARWYLNKLIESQKDDL